MGREKRVHLSCPLPDLSRSEVAIGSNLIIDNTGRIQFFDLLDTTDFDAKLIKLQARLEQLLPEKHE
jgi:hypothetical protein